MDRLLSLFALLAVLALAAGCLDEEGTLVDPEPGGDPMIADSDAGDANELRGEPGDDATDGADAIDDAGGRGDADALAPDGG